jgi:ankyrin repeat protein
MHGAEVFDVHSMVLDGDTKGVRLAAAAGMSMNEFDTDGFSPAHYAASTDNPDMLRALAEAGVDVNAPGSATGQTLASAAASRESLQVLGVLKELGADLSKPNGDGWTPAGCAAFGGRMHALRMLDVFDVDLLGPCNTQNETPLQVAKKRQMKNVVTFLTKKASPS